MAVVIGEPKSVAGQSVVGQHIQSAWWPGLFEITQGWGSTGYENEPPEDRQGKHYAHWHAGVDIGIPCGTHIQLPLGGEAKARWVDNPGGYGTALVMQFQSHDVWLGHLASRLIRNGDTARGGQDIAISNNTGNSSGCHVHMEVRPKNGGYGTDMDPSGTLAGQDIGGVPVPGDPLAALSQAITDAESEAARVFLGAGQVALGGVLLLGGLLVAARGVGAPISMPRRAPSRPPVPRGTPRPGAIDVVSRPRLRQTPEALEASARAGALAKVQRPGAMTAREAAWATAHPDQISDALRAMAQ